MSEKMRLVVIGGVAGGASAAARARRLNEDAEIILIERGEFISYANCGLPYYIGGTITERDRLLVQTPESLYRNLRIDVRTNTEAIKINRSAKTVTVRSTLTNEVRDIPYDKLILSPGAEPIRLPIPGADSPLVRTLRSISDMDGIADLINERKPSNALIIGGGYIGLEMAEAMRNRGLAVTIVELAQQVMSPMDREMATPLHKHLRLKGVDLRLETSVTEFRDHDAVISAKLSTGEEIDFGFVIMAVGVKPETKLAADSGLAIGERGGIIVDDHMRTNDPDIYAVGDAVEVKDYVCGFSTLIPLAGPANRQGRIAADNAMGRNSTYNGTQGTSICRVFDLAAGTTGANEKTLKRIGRRYQKIYIHPASHASYFPGAFPMSIKLLFDPSDGKILGAQAVGQDGVDKRIDVIATALRHGLTVFDLEELELAYAPPFGSAKDPVNYAGFVASNYLQGDVDICHVEDVLSLKPGEILLDVRTPEEYMMGTIPGAINIPLQQLRDRLNEIPQDKEILVFCQVGLRGYLACRILMQKGYACKNLSGGYKTYTMVVDVENERLFSSEEATDDAGSGAPTHSDDKAGSGKVVKIVDASGLQCPGPIMRVSNELKQIDNGEAITVLSTDPGFASDIGAWCHSTGNTLLSLEEDHGVYKATILKGSNLQRQETSSSSKKKSMIVFSGNLDRAIASFIIANGAAAMGSEVTMFFTFWGLNILRKPEPVNVEKGFVEKMFGWMMPRGADKLKLSNMNMLGIGAHMIKSMMRKKNVPSLPELIKSAQRSGVKLVACTMTMDLMGIKKEELIDGVEEGGVAMYLDRAEQGNVNLFI